MDIILNVSRTNNYPIEALLNWKAFPLAKFVLLNNNNNYNNDNNNNNNYNNDNNNNNNNYNNDNNNNNNSIAHFLTPKCALQCQIIKTYN